MLMLDTSDYNPRPTDIELATEIGQGLLGEVRRMQTILSERQDAVRQLEHEKQENQSRIAELSKQVRFKCDVEEKLKQDIWDLELAKQDLHSQVRQLSGTIQKSQTAHSKRQQQQWQSQQELETLKQAQTTWETTLQHTQANHERDLAQLQEVLAQLTADRDNIVVEVSQLKQTNAQLAQHMQQQSQRNAQRPSSEHMQALQVSLAQAHQLIETLQTDLHHEHQKRQQLDALLRESQETIEYLSSVSSSASLSSSVDTASSVVSLQEEIQHGQLKKALPFIMHTMLGEWCQKYTRLATCHQRFFWLHPYTKILYWSQQPPGLGGKTKSVLVESFSIEDSGMMTIQSSKRNIKIKCTNKESHETWIQALTCLLKDEKEETNKRLSLLLETNPPTAAMKNQK